ncbi:MAG: trehalose synthase [SAR202 cluster bacterium]|nr:trehalose synthase [SAR202 cluster bacterium]
MGAYYFHTFYREQPDLNATHPAIQDELRKIMAFWLRFGVDGFRVDAAPHMIADKRKPPGAAGPHHEVLRALRRALDDLNPDGVLVGEVDVPPEELTAYFGDGDQFHLLFNFLLDNYIFLALAREEAEPIGRVMERLLARTHALTGGWLNFLRNLDELDLERLSDGERRDVLRRFAPEESMTIYGRGARRRLAPMLRGNMDWIKMAYSLLFSLPGTPMLVYGEEIGMGDDLMLHGRNAVRVPMQWPDSLNGGFSTADPGRLIRPVLDEGPFSYHAVNVEARIADRDSLLHALKRIIRQRRSLPDFGESRFEAVASGEPSVLAFRVEGRHARVLTVHNLSGSPRRARIPRSDVGGAVEELLAERATAHDALDAVSVDLEPRGFAWYAVAGGRCRA